MAINSAVQSMQNTYGYKPCNLTVPSDALANLFNLNAMLRQGVYHPGSGKNLLIIAENYDSNGYRGILIQKTGNAVLGLNGALVNLNTRNSPFAYGFEYNQEQFSGVTAYVSTQQGKVDLGTRVERMMKSGKELAVMSGPKEDRLLSDLSNLYNESIGIESSRSNVPLFAALIAGLGFGLFVANKQKK